MQSVSPDAAYNVSHSRWLDPTMKLITYSFVLYLQHGRRDVKCKPSVLDFVFCHWGLLGFSTMDLQFARALRYCYLHKHVHLQVELFACPGGMDVSSPLPLPHPAPEVRPQ